MIIVKLIGGLGNQLFQIAFARTLSLKYGGKISIDKKAYKRYKIRDYSLTNFPISELIEDFYNSKLSTRKKIILYNSALIYHLFQKIYKIIYKTDKIGQKISDFYDKKGFYFNLDSYYYSHKFSQHQVKYLYGYFQSEMYFMEYKDQIKNDFKIKILPSVEEKNLLEEILFYNSVGVSMRLGDDYLNSKNLNVCSKEYYLNAITFLMKKINDLKIYVFSDDIERAKIIIGDSNSVVFVEGFKDYQNLRLLYSCKHFVISNSSFSWWGSYLSESPDKIIVAPNKWYSNSNETPSIFTKDMILLEV